jgi:hypothetical protein
MHIRPKSRDTESIAVMEVAIISISPYSYCFTKVRTHFGSTLNLTLPHCFADPASKHLPLCPILGKTSASDSDKVASAAQQQAERHQYQTAYIQLP